MQKLYIAYLGGKLGNGRMGEDHEAVMVVATNEKEARQKAMAKWGGVSKYGVHVDAVEKIETVDDYEIILKQTQKNEIF
jgi:hypothetical protein